MTSTTPRTPGQRRPRTAGFTMSEMMVALVLLGLVMGALFTVLLRQQRFYRSANDLIDTRTQVRQAVAMLPPDLRTISTGDTPNNTDVYEASDKAIEFRAIFGSSFICRKLSATRIILPPVDLAKDTRLTAWMRKPVVGDSILVYDDGKTVGGDDDAWKARKITAVTELAATSTDACLVTSGFVQAADVTAGRVSYEINVQSGTGHEFLSTTAQGAPIRFFRRRRYELYQPTGSTSWYLGRYDCDHAAGTCPALSPVSGPFAAYSATVANSGLSFLYYKADGTAFVPANTTADKAQIARIQLVARADTRSPIDMPGRAKATVRDSLSYDIALRNTK